jgi:hypothetical protein
MNAAIVVMIVDLPRIVEPIELSGDAKGDENEAERAQPGGRRGVAAQKRARTYRVGFRS